MYKPWLPASSSWEGFPPPYRRWGGRRGLRHSHFSQEGLRRKVDLHSSVDIRLGLLTVGMGDSIFLPFRREEDHVSQQPQTYQCLACLSFFSERVFLPFLLPHTALT